MRLIDADAFVERKRAFYCKDCDMRKNSKGKVVYEIGDVPCRACDIGDLLDAIEDVPTVDAVQVVRCGECKHRAGHMDGYTECDRTERIRIWHPDDWYCAYGKRRKE